MKIRPVGDELFLRADKRTGINCHTPQFCERAHKWMQQGEREGLYSRPEQKFLF
jgi:hypothetical protein